MGPSGVIDFIQPLSSAGPDQSHVIAADDPADPYAVRGGPPAYLETHGVRYVPASTATASSLQTESASELVAMSKPFDEEEEEEEEPGISDSDLNSRVDERIKHFLNRSRGQPHSAPRMHAKAARLETDTLQKHTAMTARLEALHEQMLAQSKPSRMQAQPPEPAPSRRTNPLAYDW
jgi:TPP-dependent pyruvate/acetoin dehydrogenase alpha subunit